MQIASVAGTPLLRKTPRSFDLLPKMGAIYEPGRVVVDRDRITGGGVTAGIDFALRVAAEIAGEQVAKAIQLGLEYNPEPPFRSGHPDVAGGVGHAGEHLEPAFGAGCAV